MRDGAIELKIDPKFPQALGINSINHHVAFYGNSPWEVLRNSEADISPFFTSDYPVAIEVIDIKTPLNRIIPLAPDLAIRIKPDIQLRGTQPDPSFSRFRAVQRTLKRNELLTINRLIVRCAEDLVFFRDDAAWVEDFAAKNAGYHVETATVQGTETHRILQRKDVAPR